MAKAALKINGEDFLIEDDLVTIGRASDNKIALANDSNVSRYHAEIENRAGEFWLVELGSSNGTTLNGAPVAGEILLEDGDLIVLGGTSEIEFRAGAAAETETEKPVAAAISPSANAPNLSGAALPSPTVSAPAAEASKMSPMLIVMGLACGLAIISIAAVVVFSTGLVSFGGAAKCEVKAAITSPENGEIISKETEITVSAEKTECVRRAAFMLGETEIAAAENAPYTVTIDPKNFPSFADGENHSLKLIFEDNQGNRIPASEIILAFETAAIATPTPTPDEEETPAPTETPAPSGKKTSLIEIQEMSRRVLKQFSGSFNYKFDEQFLQEVQRKTAEYAAAEGFSARAENYRDLINFEFHKENGLDAPLGFLLAMSRSKFDLQKRGADEGLWQLSEEFVAGNGYKTACQAESLSDKSQNCAAKTAAIYTKALILKIFNGDVVYAVAAFGMSEGEASAWANSLPPSRENFWRVVANPKQREQLAKFFAAAIVAENPQKFGLKKDKPISAFYRNLIGN